MSRKSARSATKTEVGGKEPRKRRTQQERTAESTQRLTQAAIELIAEKGFDKTTTAEIGERAGYSRSMVQFRYGTKDAFLESLLREEYETRLLGPTPPGMTGLEQILTQIDMLTDQVVEAPALMRGFFVLCFETVGPLKGLVDWLADWLVRYQKATVGAIRTGIEDGSIHSDVDPEQEAGSLISTCLGNAFRWTAMPDAVDFTAEMRTTREQVETRLAAR